MALNSSESDNCCPFIDLDDTRCAGHFSICRLNDAFGVCMGFYWQCPTYYQLKLERAGEWIALTIGGKPAQPGAV